MVDPKPCMMTNILRWMGNGLPIPSCAWSQGQPRVYIMAYPKPDILIVTMSNDAG